jgi:DNA-directed RNA polymerase subunit delta
MATSCMPYTNSQRRPMLGGIIWNPESSRGILLINHPYGELTPCLLSVIVNDPADGPLVPEEPFFLEWIDEDDYEYEYDELLDDDLDDDDDDDLIDDDDEDDDELIDDDEEDDDDDEDFLDDDVDDDDDVEEDEDEFDDDLDDVLDDELDDLDLDADDDKF